MIKITINDFEKKYRNKFPDRNYYDFSEAVYVNNRTKLKIICRKHNTEFYISPDNFLAGKCSCVECIKEKKFLGTEDQRNVGEKCFREFMKEHHPDIEILGKYVNRVTPIKMKCKIHPNEIFWKSPKTITRQDSGKKRRQVKEFLCPECKKIAESKKKLENWIIEFNKRYPNNHFDFSNSIWTTKKLDDHIKVVTKIENIKCNICGEILSATPCIFINSPHCSSCDPISVGEYFTKTWLSDHKINYEFQKSFSNDEIIGRTSTSGVVVDFVVQYNNRTIFIECNGEMHYRYCPLFCKNGEESFMQQINRDNNVKEYCKINNIEFIEIPWTYYTKNKIDYILTETIIEGNKIEDIIKIPKISLKRNGT